MAKSIAVIGIDATELGWARILLSLLRHPDPLIGEMVRQALLYLERNAHEQAQSRVEGMDHAG